MAPEATAIKTKVKVVKIFLSVSFMASPSVDARYGSAIIPRTILQLVGFKFDKSYEETQKEARDYMRAKVWNRKGMTPFKAATYVSLVILLIVLVSVAVQNLFVAVLFGIPVAIFTYRKIKSLKARGKW